MSSCLIICAGEIRNYADLAGRFDNADYVICADGGYLHAKAMGIVPDLLVGDFDSIDALPNGIETVTLPAEKDFTDTEFAVREGMRRGFDDFILIGAAGGRLDHFFGNIAVLKLLCDENKNGRIIDESNDIRLLSFGTHTVDRADGYLSLIPMFCGAVHGVTLRGVKYPLENAEVKAASTLCSSNEFAADRAEVSFLDGYLLLVISRDRGFHKNDAPCV